MNVEDQEWIRANLEMRTHLNEILDREGLDALTNGQFDGSFEIAAAINRLRLDGSFVQLR